MFVKSFYNQILGYSQPKKENSIFIFSYFPFLHFILLCHLTFLKIKVPRISRCFRSGNQNGAGTHFEENSCTKYRNITIICEFIFCARLLFSQSKFPEFPDVFHRKTNTGQGPVLREIHAQNTETHPFIRLLLLCRFAFFYLHEF